MAVPLIAGAVAGGVLSFIQNRQQSAMARYEQRIAQANADLLRAQASKVIERADREAGQIRTQSRQVIGSQRTIAAASNVAIDTGNVADIQDQTEIIALNEGRKIRNNAFLDALNIKTQALNYEFKGEQAVSNVESGAALSVVSGAFQGFSAMGGFGALSKTGGATVPQSEPVATTVESTSNMSSGTYGLGSSYFSSGRSNINDAPKYSLNSERYSW